MTLRNIRPISFLYPSASSTLCHSILTPWYDMRLHYLTDILVNNRSEIKTTWTHNVEAQHRWKRLSSRICRCFQKWLWHPLHKRKRLPSVHTFANILPRNLFLQAHLSCLHWVYRRCRTLRGEHETEPVQWQSSARLWLCYAIYWSRTIKCRTGYTTCNCRERALNYLPSFARVVDCAWILGLYCHSRVSHVASLVRK